VVSAGFSATACPTRCTSRILTVRCDVGTALVVPPRSFVIPTYTRCVDALSVSIPVPHATSLAAISFISAPQATLRTPLRSYRRRTRRVGMKSRFLRRHFVFIRVSRDSSAAISFIPAPHATRCTTFFTYRRRTRLDGMRSRLVRCHFVFSSAIRDPSGAISYFSALYAARCTIFFGGAPRDAGLSAEAMA
jgi:hypothetical protein